MVRNLPLLLVAWTFASLALAKETKVEPGAEVQGTFVGGSAFVASNTNRGASVILGRRSHTAGTMGQSWAGVALGAAAGKDRYGYGLVETGYLGVMSGKAGIGYYRDSENDEGTQAEVGVGMIAGMVYGRVRQSAATRARAWEIGIMAVLPICEC